MSKKPADSASSTDLPLPHADRPIASAPGHWVLARAGKRVLRPGGAALSTAMLGHARLAGADVVVGEAMLTMQGDKGKAAIVAEAARVLRPGGRYAIHELGVTPDDIDEDYYTQLRRDLARSIHVNARPMTAAAWKELMEGAGLVVDWVDTAPMALLKVGRNIRDEGLGGFLRIARNVAADKALRQRVQEMAATFKRYEKDMVGIALVAHKPAS